MNMGFWLDLINDPELQKEIENLEPLEVLNDE